MQVQPHKKVQLIKLMFERNENGGFKYGQRQLGELTGVSNTAIRKVGKDLGRVWAEHGITLRSPIWMCFNCGGFFRRSFSHATQYDGVLCSSECKKSHQAKMASKKIEISGFLKWMMNHELHEPWKQKMIAAKRACEITGLTDNLEAYHIAEQRYKLRPMEQFKSDSGIVLNKGVRDELYEIMKNNRITFEQASIQLKEKHNGIRE